MKAWLLATAILLTLPLSAQVQQGKDLYQQGRFEEAKRVLTPLARDAEAQDTLGMIALQQNQPEKAVEWLEKAIAQRPNEASFHFDLGQAYGILAQRANILKQASLASKVKREFEKAVQLDPNLLDARFGLIDFYVIAPALMGGSEAKALDQAEEIKKRDSYMGHRAYARIYQRQKKFDLARKEFVDAVREQPNSARAHNSLGAFLGLTDKNYKVAFEEIEKAIALDPSFMPSYFRIGQMAATSGAQLARGEESLKKYLAYNPKENEPDLASAHYYMGMIYEKMGKVAEARLSYAAAVQMNPGSKTFTEALKRVS